MRIGQNCDYDKKNIGNTSIPYRITKSWLYPWQFRDDDFNLINKNLGSVASLIVTTVNQGYRDMNYGINWEVYTPYELWYQLRGIYSICRCCWTVAISKCLVHFRLICIFRHKPTKNNNYMENTILWFFNILTLSIPDQGYCRNASFALNSIPTLFY